MRKFFTVSLMAIVALSLTACTKSTSTSSASSSIGPSKWSEAEVYYLQEIYASKLSANQVFSEGVFVDIGHTVCNSFTQGRSAGEVMNVLAVTAEKNGLPIGDRTNFGPTVGAAAVTYLCPENLNKLVK